MSAPRFVHSCGDILLDGARLSLVMAEDMRLIFEDEWRASLNAGVSTEEAARIAGITFDLETAMEGARQWHAAARGVAR